MKQYTFSYNIPADEATGGFSDLSVEVNAVQNNDGSIAIELNKVSGLAATIIKDWVKLLDNVEAIAKMELSKISVEKSLFEQVCDMVKPYNEMIREQYNQAS